MLPKVHIEIEKWKFNKNYNLYVSNLGNFKDKSKEDIKLVVEKGGYLQIPVCNNKQGKVKYLQAHRVVMETWCPKQNMWKDKLTVDHLDHNKRNNKTKNLEWVTKQENQRRAIKDMVYDDKDALIQSLKDQIRNLEDKINHLEMKSNLKITANNIHTFRSWQEVKNWYIGIYPNAKNMKMETLIKAVTKAATNKTLYIGYNWQIEY